MPVPKNADLSNPRKTMAIIVRCFKSDYKAESCMYRPCDECRIGHAVSDFDVRDTFTIQDERKVKKVLELLGKKTKRKRRANNRDSAAALRRAAKAKPKARSRV